MSEPWWLMGLLESVPWYGAPMLAVSAGLCALAPLGRQVLARRVVFMDLAVAQAAAAGGLCGVRVLEHPGPWAIQLAAVLGAWLCVAVIVPLIRRARATREAMIGLLYVLGASVAVLAARLDPHGHEHLTQWLAADVVWASWAQAWGLVSLAVCMVVGSRRGWLQQHAVFYFGFATVVSVAVATLGLLVVFAGLVVPALWQRVGWGTWRALALTIAAAGVGWLLSWYLDGPSGPCVALALAVCGLASVIGRSAGVARP